MRPDKSDEEEARAAEDPQGSEETAAADEVGEDEGAPGGSDDRMKFRPSFLDESEARQAQAPAPAPDGDIFFVTVEREGAGEVHRFGDPVEAQRFVESLLEDGVPEEGVSAFAGHRLTVQVRHRPVVKLSIGSDA